MYPLLVIYLLYELVYVPDLTASDIVKRGVPLRKVFDKPGKKPASSLKSDDKTHLLRHSMGGFNSRYFIRPKIKRIFIPHYFCSNKTPFDRY
jgi:hypothetical protein